MTTCPRHCYCRVAVVLSLFVVALYLLLRPTSGLADPIASVGGVTATTARIWALFPDEEALRDHTVEYRPQQQQRAQHATAWQSAFERDADATFLTSVTTLAHLEPSTTYAFRVRWPQQQQQQQPLAELNGTFRTLADASLLPRTRATTTTRRLLFGSCILPELSGTTTLGPLNRALEVLRPDLSLLLGDTIYADVGLRFGFRTDAAWYADKYRRLWAVPSFRRLAKLAPMVAMFDDHELRDNWSGAKAPGLNESMRAWQAFAGGARNPPAAAAGAHYFTVTLMPSVCEIFVLDTRTFRQRTKPGTADRSLATMLGAEQEEALAAWLRASPARIKLVASPSAFSLHQGWSIPGTDYEVDGWNLAAEARAKLFDLVQEGQCRGTIGPVALLSGDVHYAAAVAHRSGSLYEFGASPLISHPLPKKAQPAGVDAQGRREREVLLHASDFRYAHAHAGLVQVIRPPPRSSTQSNDEGEGARLNVTLLEWNAMSSIASTGWSIELSEDDMMPDAAACARILALAEEVASGARRREGVVAAVDDDASSSSSSSSGDDEGSRRIIRAGDEL